MADRDPRITLRCPAVLVARLDAEARRRRGEGERPASRSALVRAALTDYLAAAEGTR